MSLDLFISNSSKKIKKFKGDLFNRLSLKKMLTNFVNDKIWDLLDVFRNVKKTPLQSKFAKTSPIVAL